MAVLLGVNAATSAVTYLLKTPTDYLVQGHLILYTKRMPPAVRESLGALILT